jgi:hypothetical protein
MADFNLTGSLFKNERKRADRQDPDFTGQADVAGTAYWIDAWVNEKPESGRKYLRLKFRPKDSRITAKPVAAAAAAADPIPFDDDIPF